MTKQEEKYEFSEGLFLWYTDNVTKSDEYNYQSVILTNFSGIHHIRK